MDAKSLRLNKLNQEQLFHKIAVDMPVGFCSRLFRVLNFATVLPRFLMYVSDLSKVTPRYLAVVSSSRFNEVYI